MAGSFFIEKIFSTPTYHHNTQEIKLFITFRHRAHNLLNVYQGEGTNLTNYRSQDTYKIEEVLLWMPYKHIHRTLITYIRIS